MRSRLLLLAVVLAVAAPGFETPAAALSCSYPTVVGGGEPQFPDPYKGNYDAIIEGVPLSGPSNDGDLGEPARFLVTRWIKGRGPRIVPVGSATDTGVSASTMVTPGYYQPRPGEVARLFADRERGILYPAACLFGDDRPEPRSPLRKVARSEVRDVAAGRAWRAHSQRGRQGLHCVAAHPEGRHTGGGRECEVGRPLLAVQHEGGRVRVGSTAIIVAGTGIRSVSLRTPDGPIDARPRRDGVAVLEVLSGRVDAAEVRARVILADGSVRWLQPAGYRTALTPDPELGRPWRSAIDDGFPFRFSKADAYEQCVGAKQLEARDGNGSSIGSAGPVCGDLRRDPYFFGIEQPRPYADRENPRPEPVRTVVLGAARPSVAEVVVRDPAGERRLTRGPGGQFAAVYPASVAPASLEVTVVFRDGSTVTHRGRGGANGR